MISDIAIVRFYRLFGKAKNIGYRIFSECTDRHAIHRFCVNSVMPYKTAENFSQRPVFAETSLKNGVCQKIGGSFPLCSQTHSIFIVISLHILFLRTKKPKGVQSPKCQPRNRPSATKCLTALITFAAFVYKKITEKLFLGDFLKKFGDPSEILTPDTMIKSHVLYLLS